MDDVSWKMAGTETIGQTTERLLRYNKKRSFSLPYSSFCTHLPLYIRESSPSFVRSPRSDDNQRGKTIKTPHTASAHRWCALNRDIHSPFSFQTSLTWSGNETIHYTSATWETTSTWSSTHGRVGPGRHEWRAGNSFLLSSVF